MTPSDSHAQASPSGASNSDSREGGIGLIDLAIVLARHKKLVLGLPLCAAVLAAIVSMLSPSIYTATTKVLPPQGGQSGGAGLLLGQLGGMGGGTAGIPGLKNPADLYVGMLNSRTVADALIKRFDLSKRYDATLPSHARARLASNTKITAGKESIISIEFDDRDPQQAADIANGYVEELFKLTTVMAVTEASQRRLFFERQLAKAKADLSIAEAAARTAIQSGGLVKVDEQGRALLETTAKLRAQISLSKVKIDAMRIYAANRNPELLLAQQELEAAKRELAKLEGVTGKAEVTHTSAAGQGMGNLALLRDVKYNEAVFDLMAKQLEMAKIDESQDSSLLQVIDSAVPPDRRSKPKRRLIVMTSTLAALFLAILAAVLRESVARAKNDPENAARLNLLRRHLGFK